MKKNTGFSLIETLVVVSIFALIGAVVSQSTVFTLTGAKKSDSASKVRESLDNALTVMERQLRSARSITTPCNGSNLQTINYIDQDGVPSSFSCENIAQPTSYIASGSAQLTNPVTVAISACKFICAVPNPGQPATVNIEIAGQGRNSTGVENSTVTLETGVTLRAY